MNEEMPAWAARMDEKLDGLRDGLREVKNKLDGGDDYSSGMVVRLDRLEQESERQKERGREVRAVAWSGLGTGVTAFIAWFWSNFVHKG